MYTELLSVLFEHPATTIKEEAMKIQKIGKKVGKLVRVAIGFDLFDKFAGEYGEYFKDDEEDFD